MPKRQYSIVQFPLISVKSPLATLAGHVLGITERIFENFRAYAEEYYGQSPRWILHNMMQNNETIFNFGVPDILSSTMSNQQQPSLKSSVPLKEESIYVCQTEDLPFEDRQKDISGNENMDIKYEALKRQESAIKLPTSLQGGSISISIKEDLLFLDRLKETSRTENLDVENILTKGQESVKKLPRIFQEDSFSLCPSKDLPFGSKPTETSGPENLEAEHKVVKGPEVDKNSPRLSQGELISLCPTEDFAFEDRPRETSESQSIETKNTAAERQELTVACENVKILSTPTVNEKLDIALVKGVKTEISSKEKKISSVVSKDIKDLIERNLVDIKSISVIKQADSIGVEIDIDSSRMSHCSTSENPLQSSNTLKIIKSPDKPDIKNRSPSRSPSKRLKTTEVLSIASESHLTVDYSDQNILNFLAKRSLSILSCRKSYMEQIHNCFKKFQRDVNDFKNTIDNIKFVVENLPMAHEPYATDDLIKLRNDLINKANQMLEKAGLLVEGVEKDADVFNKCVREINNFEKEHVPLLSSGGESTLTAGYLKKLEVRLREICKNADNTVILKDSKRESLLNLSSDFEWLVNHFVKFLIITEILKPPVSASSGVEKD